MEELRQQTTKNEEPVNLNSLFMDLFAPEFLASLPPGQIETVINSLKQMESASETIPPEWSALRSVLQERGFFK